MVEYQEQRIQELHTEINCKLCDAIVHTTDEYYHHLKTHCPEKSRKCPVCQKIFKQRSSLFVHLRSCSQSKQCGTPDTVGLKCVTHTCRTCNNAFKYDSHRKMHERIHTDERPYKCTYCNKAFTHLTIKSSMNASIQVSNHTSVHTVTSIYTQLQSKATSTHPFRWQTIPVYIL